MSKPDAAVLAKMERTFRKEYTKRTSSVLDYLANREVLELFAGVDEIKWESAVLLGFDENEWEWKKRIWNTASTLKWATANGIVQHVDIREPNDRFVVVDRRYHFIVCGKGGLGDLRVINSALSPEKLEKALRRERNLLRRDQPELIETVTEILQRLMERFPEAPVPFHLKYLEKPDFPYLRSYFDILVDAACDLNGRQVIAELRWYLTALVGAAPQIDYMAETTEQEISVKDRDDVFALENLDFNVLIETNS